MSLFCRNEIVSHIITECIPLAKNKDESRLNRVGRGDPLGIVQITGM